MNQALTIRAFLDDRRAIFRNLRTRQQKLNSPTFSCKQDIDENIEDPVDEHHLGRLILQKVNYDEQTNEARLFGNIELLKCGIRILNLQNELGLRRGEDAGLIESEMDKMDFLLAFAQAAREKSTFLNPLGNDDERRLSAFFDIAADKINNARMGVDIPDITFMDEGDIEAELTQARCNFAGLVSKQIDLSLSEVCYTQNITLQLERGIVKKFVPDTKDFRDGLEGYRTICNKLLQQTQEDMDALEGFDTNLSQYVLPDYMRKSSGVIVPLPIPAKYSLAMPHAFMP